MYASKYFTKQPRLVRPVDIYAVGFVVVPCLVTAGPVVCDERLSGLLQALIYGPAGRVWDLAFIVFQNPSVEIGIAWNINGKHDRRRSYTVNSFTSRSRFF